MIVSATSAEVFRENLLARMKELGISGVELARRLGCTPPQVSIYLTGVRKPGVDMLDRFAVALDLTPAELITPREEKIPA